MRSSSLTYLKIFPTKRFFDLMLAIPAFILLSPVWVALAVLIQCKIGKPIFFCQIRPGIKGKSFKIYKFRTMSNSVDKNGHLLPDKDRLSKIGSFLRSTSLDELPELYNVLKGEMSIVGPRPLLMQYLERYTPKQARRHEVRPGITGWAQINGRNTLIWEERFKLDVWYVDNQSLWLDIKIILLTIVKVFKREGINEPGQATMTEFMGN